MDVLEFVPYLFSTLAPMMFGDSPMTTLHRPARRPVVLVVDDFQDGRELVAEYLAFRGFTVHTATDGAEAIEVADAARPDVVLLDLSMPGIDGWQAARILKSSPATRKMIIVAVTAHALARETQAARDAGCDGVICKPFDLTALGDALPRLLTHGTKALDVPGLSLTLPQPKRRPARPMEQNES